MPYCNACGAEVPEGARFCQNCGAPVGSPAMQEATAPTRARAEADPTLPPPAAMPPPMPTPPYPTYPPPPYAVVPGQPYVPRHNGKAVAGMWLGIVSIPGMILSWIGIIIGILGLIFSLLGLSELRTNAANPLAPPQSGRTQALVGIILSIVGIAASTAVLVYFLTHLAQYGIRFTT